MFQIPIFHKELKKKKYFNKNCLLSKGNIILCKQFFFRSNSKEDFKVNFF